jgi:hypothetical protein
MFDELMRRLKQLETIAIKLDLDEDGYLDRECPSDQCLFQFKVNGEDRSKLGKKEPSFCPLCGHSAPPDSWNTTEQVDHAMEQGKAFISGQIGDALAADAQNFNRRQPNSGFLRMSMGVRGFKHGSVVVPAPAKDTLTLKITCDKCSFHFSVVGSAFFCPHCGHTSVERLFDDAIRKVLAKLDVEPKIREALESSISRDDTELTCRSLIESSLSDCVGAFQSLAEAIHSRKAIGKPPRRNAFQNLDEGGLLWQAAFGKGYDSWLAQEELKELNAFFQQRHLLAHREGLVDQGYLDKSGDARYAVAQRLVIKAPDVRRLADLVARLGAGLKSSIDVE